MSTKPRDCCTSVFEELNLFGITLTQCNPADLILSGSYFYSGRTSLKTFPVCTEVNLKKSFEGDSRSGVSDAHRAPVAMARDESVYKKHTGHYVEVCCPLLRLQKLLVHGYRPTDMEILFHEILRTRPLCPQNCPSVCPTDIPGGHSAFEVLNNVHRWTVDGQWIHQRIAQWTMHQPDRRTVPCKHHSSQSRYTCPLKFSEL
jgi:hypothetical protein